MELDLTTLTEKQIAYEIQEWKKQPITRWLIKHLAHEFEQDLLSGRIPKAQGNSSFDYDVGYKDGKNNTVFKIIKLEEWLYDNLDRGEIDE